MAEGEFDPMRSEQDFENRVYDVDYEEPYDDLYNHVLI